MEVELARDLSLVLLAALLGGGVASLFRLPLLTGYIIAGIVFAAVAPLFQAGGQVLQLASLGIILLLFTLGIELTLARISRVFQIAVLGGLVQILFTTLIGIFILAAFGITGIAAFILAFSFSLSSTAVVIKILLERGEIDTLPGEILSGWLLVQDLAVIPVVVLLPLMAEDGQGYLALPASVAKALMILVAAFVLGRIAFPRFLHWVAGFNSREFLLLATASLVFATAGLASIFGLTPALGAFVAGLVISETSQNHAVFAEIRPLREIFMVLFFVSLGALVDVDFLFSSLNIIVALTIIFIALKFLITFSLLLLFGYHARTGFWVATGLANIGEFSFILVVTAGSLGLLDGQTSSLAISVTIASLLATTLLFRLRIPGWRKTRFLLERSGLSHFVGSDRHGFVKDQEIRDHVIICGFGRMGSWLGRACQLAHIPFVVIEYNARTVEELKNQGVPVIYGDPSDEEVLESAQVARAKLLVIAIPDRLTQELVITHAHTRNSKLKIISRTSLETDRAYLTTLGQAEVIQPEFEAALTVVHRVLQSYGASREEVAKRIKTIKGEHSKVKT